MLSPKGLALPAVGRLSVMKVRLFRKRSHVSFLCPEADFHTMPSDFTFPVTTEGNGLTQQQRQQMNLRSLGSIHPHTTAVAGPSKSMKGKTEVWYNVSGTELEEVITKHRRALSIHRIKVSH